MVNFNQINDAELDNVNGGAYTGKAYYYVVKRGDSLTSIARATGTSVSILVEINNISNPDIIKVGQKLLIPCN